MKKLFLISLFLITGLISCSKKEEADTKTTDGCWDCTIKATYYSHGVQTNHVENVQTFCGKESDMQTNQTANTHSDSTLIQTCNCLPQ